MTFEEIKLLCDGAVSNNLMFEKDSVMLNTAEGSNHATLAVLGTLSNNIGKLTFNKYLDAQVFYLGWLASKNNVITQFAYKLKGEYRTGNRTAISMFKDAEQNFINPIISAHVKSGGASITVKQKEAVCAILIAKITWDYNLGNTTLAKHLRMLDDSFLKEIEAFRDGKS